MCLDATAARSSDPDARYRPGRRGSSLPSGCAAPVARELLPEVEGRRHLSCTIGVAEHRKGENTRLVLARAEAHLNLGKAGGRDRVVAEVRR